MNSNFVGIMVDVLKQWRQGAQERYQYLRRRSQWIRLSDDARKELAAVIIQRNFRSYQSRKWMRLVKRQVEKREEEIIMLVQKAIRKRCKAEIEQDESVLEELELLHEQAEQERHSKWNRVNNLSALVGPTPLDDDEDRKRKYILREEVQRKIDSEKQKLMLLRPDSTFVLQYQLLYVLCAIIETAHLVLQPWLEEGEEQPKTWIVDTVRYFFGYGQTFVSLVLCLGILIKFFVGEIDTITGRLVPRSFFARWIYPGILLHLIVNPSLEEISYIVKRVILFMLRAGPGRVWRWWILLFLPIWRRLLLWWEWRIWMRLVRRENQSLTCSARPQRLRFNR